MPLPPFADPGRWRKRVSGAKRYIRRRVWYDPETGYEYEPDPTPMKRTWHEIDWRRGYYREIDPATGRPVAGGEGDWHRLQ